MSRVTIQDFQGAVTWDAALSAAMPAVTLLGHDDGACASLLRSRFTVNTVAELVVAVDGNQDARLSWVAVGRLLGDSWFGLSATRTTEGWQALAHVAFTMQEVVKYAFTPAERDRLWEALVESHCADALGWLGGHSA